MRDLLIIGGTCVRYERAGPARRRNNVRGSAALGAEDKGMTRWGLLLAIGM